MNDSQDAKPQASAKGGRKPPVASVAAVLIVIIAVLFIAYYYTSYHAPPPSTTTTISVPTTYPSTTTPTTTIMPSFNLTQLTTPQNALFSLPSSPALNEYNHNSSFGSNSDGWVISQYGANFTSQLLSSPNVIKPNQYTINVPTQFANTTSPVIVSLQISMFTNGTDALNNYIKNVQLFSNSTKAASNGFSNISQFNITGVGDRAMFQSYTAYGLSANAIYSLFGNYTSLITLIGTKHMQVGHVYNITDHVLSILANATAVSR